MDQHHPFPGILQKREFFVQIGVNSKHAMKISRQALIKKRNNKENVFLVTGATGFIGSHTAIALLKRGYRVVMLCRSNKNGSAQERVNRLLDWFQMTGSDELSRLEVVEGFLDRPNLGLRAETFAYLSETIDEIVHCAAGTSFSEKKRDELENTNIKNLENLLKLAAATNSKCYYFHHVSTVYSAGRRDGTFEEKLVETKTFHNVYEETKYRGELYVSETFPKEGIMVNIYRSSIVCGNSETGRSFRFNGIYYPVKMALFLKDIYQKDITLGDGEKARQMGVRVEENGAVHLPVRMENKTGGSLNLVPVNYFTDAFIALLEECSESDIFHIVSNSPKTLDDILCYFRKLFKIQGFRPVSKESFDETPANGLEILFNGYLKMFGPYIRDTRRFDNRKAEAILQKKNISCPEFDFNVFSRCMNYAIVVGWRNPWE